MIETNLRWQLFLNDKAVQAKLTPGQIEVFTYQFDLEREHRSIPEIKDSIYKDKHIGGENYKRIIGDVYAKLTDLGIDFDKATADKPDVVWQWLKQSYPQWEEKFLGRSKLGIDALWTQLKALGKYAPERMGAYVVQNKIDTAGAARGFGTRTFPDTVPQGTEGLKFKILTEKMGQVLLLNYSEAKVVYCLCPSKFAASMNFDRGEKILPEPTSPFAALGVDIGREEWWCWILPEIPPLIWLGAARDNVLELNAMQLAELLSKVELQQGEVLHTFYRVV